MYFELKLLQNRNHFPCLYLYTNAGIDSRRINFNNSRLRLSRISFYDTADSLAGTHLFQQMCCTIKRIMSQHGINTALEAP